MSLLTLARDLRRRRGRERQQRFVAEGIRTVEALLASPLRVEGALLAPMLDATPRGAAVRARLAQATRVEVLTDREFAEVSDTDTPQGVLAIAEIPAVSLGDLRLPPRARLLLLDGVQDPGNVGTMIRTAAALGASRTLILPGTVDPWNAKVVRSAMGALFHDPPIACTWDAWDAFRSSAGVALWVADASGEGVGERPAPARLALAVGNEGAGAGAEARQRAEHVVGIPLAPGAESLNAAVAAGILLHALRP